MADAAPWALILGASSGFGEATSLELARSGYNIAGVHLQQGDPALGAADVELGLRGPVEAGRGHLEAEEGERLAHGPVEAVAALLPEQPPEAVELGVCGFG